MTRLPVGWAEAPLGDVADVVRGVTYDKREAASAPADGLLPILRATNIEQTLNLESEMVYVPAHRVSADQRVRLGDIVIAASSGSRSVVGKSAPLLSSWDGGFGAFCAVVRPRPAVTTKYIAHLVSSPHVRELWRDLSKGTNINNLKRSDLAATLVPIPPRAEQERIVAAIEETFSRLDAGVKALSRVRCKLDRMRDTIRFSATRGTLVSQDTRDEPASVSIARVRPSGRFRGDGPLPTTLGPLPSGWSWALMGSLAQRITVGHVGPMKDEYVPEGIPFLRSQNVRAGRYEPRGLLYISRKFHERLEKSRLRPGDLVVVRSGNVGTACVVPNFLHDANCADLVIIQSPEAITPGYASLYMNSLARARVRIGQVGVALTHFNTQSVAELPVPVPPLAEQDRITAEADRLMSLVDTLHATVVDAERKASTIRSSILGAAFSGKLVPQDTGEEPAADLIRIATERASQNGHEAVRAVDARTMVPS